MKQFSVRDIAKMAGISISTVSRVLNNSNKVHPETKSRIENIIREHNYKPSIYAQRLRTQFNNSKLIGMFLPDIQNPFYLDVINGVESYLSKLGYAIVIGNYSKDGKEDLLYIDIFQTESIAGYIVAPAFNNDKQIKKLVQLGSSIVCINGELDDYSTDIVKVDNERGSFEATSHLINLGHNKIALITESKNVLITKEKINGYKRALEANSIGIVNEYILLRNNEDKTVEKLLNSLLDLSVPPTALILGSNLIVLEALNVLYREQYSIPKDIALIGFDDMPWFKAVNPAITAIRQSGYEIGKRAAEQLIQRIENPDRAVSKIIMKTKLVIRNSCGSNETPYSNIN